MLEQKDAYIILGVKEDASKDEIVKRFDVLMRIHKSALLETDDKQSEENNFQKINAAYNLLMGYRQEDKEKLLKELENKPSNNPILRKLNLNESKIKNNIYYYKFHVLISILIILLLGLLFKSCIDRVEPDLNLVFMGDYYFSSSDTDQLEKNIKNSIPQIKGISSQVITISEKNDGQQAYAMQMKAVTVMVAGDVDILLLDKANFDKYAVQGAFVSLDDITSDATPSIKKYKAKTKDDQTEHVYGIDASGSSIFSSEDFKGKEFIAAISVRKKHLEDSKKLISLIGK